MVFSELPPLHFPFFERFRVSLEPSYQLIDFGDGKKLERIGGLLVERPSPGASGPPLGSGFWNETDLTFRQNRWVYPNPAIQQRAQREWSLPVAVHHAIAKPLQLKLNPTSSGQVGIFPEHWAHWDWFYQKVQTRVASDRPLRVLHLFAYTGATTLALASMGCEVTHVDASKPTVLWARENAELSGLKEASVRWIVEDAAKFAMREVKRGKEYDAIILDPPSFGHGTKSERWEIQRDLQPLLASCWELLSEARSFVLLCGHSADIRLREVAADLSAQFGKSAVGKNSIHKSFLESNPFGEDPDNQESSAILDCGYVSKFEWDSLS